MTGRRVEFVPISDEEFDADLAAAGIPAEYEEGMEHPVIGTSSRRDILSYEQGVRGGWFALLSDDVERLTGRQARCRCARASSGIATRS